MFYTGIPGASTLDLGEKHLHLLSLAARDEVLRVLAMRQLRVNRRDARWGYRNPP